MSTPTAPTTLLPPPTLPASPETSSPPTPYVSTGDLIAAALLAPVLPDDPESLDPKHPGAARALAASLVRAAAAQLALAEDKRGRNISKRQREAFLIAVAVGVGVHAAADFAGCSMNALYGIRRRDAEFRASWDDALEASLDSVDTRLLSIALHGDPGSMATVRAAELLARGRRKSERRDLAAQTAIEAQQTNAAGETQTIRVLLRTPLPD